MRATSLWQPWASLWCSRRKRHETRHWPLNYRGWLLVHAAQRFIKNVEPELREVLEDQFGDHWARDLDCGALVGMVHIVDCRRTEDIVRGFGPVGSWSQEDQDDYACGNFAPERYGFLADDFITFDRAIPWKGQQAKTFAVPDEALPLHVTAAAGVKVAA